MKLNNCRPEKVARYLIKNGWVLVNSEGTHETYFLADEKGKFIKDKNGLEISAQVLYNYKTIHWKNMKILVKKTGISEEKFNKYCK